LNIKAKTKNDLIENPLNNWVHVVLLGAGASRAAFPKGDALGKTLPVMNDLIDILGLSEFLQKHDIKSKGKNFENIYSDI
jgi:hypothetical protein